MCARVNGAEDQRFEMKHERIKDVQVNFWQTKQRHFESFKMFIIVSGSFLCLGGGTNWEHGQKANYEAINITNHWDTGAVDLPTLPRGQLAGLVRATII